MLTSPLLPLYGEPPLTLVSGEGCRVTDDRGRAYLDFTAGIAVTALGHGSSVVREAVERALATGLVHTSNLYRTRPAVELAETLVSLAFPGGVFFCNSGGEANEAALKFARRWSGDTHEVRRTGVLAFRGSFHGRLFGTLAITDRPKYRDPFVPVMPGAEWAEVGDVAGVRAILERRETAAVFLEPVQGEGGVRPIEPGFLAELRAACTDTDTLLVFDEVQCGLGRTGDVFAHQAAGVVPDILTLAKPLAGGLPMGAVIASEKVAATLHPGDHATTFGGGPLVATVAQAVVATVTAPAFLEAVRVRGRRLREGLEGLVARGRATAVRGRGLMQGLVVDGDVGPVVSRAREGGLLLVGAGPDVLRFVPPLVVSDDEIDEAVRIVDEALS